MGLLQAAWRGTLRLLPSDFRREYGAEMEAVVAERWAAMRDVVGPLGAVRFWSRQTWATGKLAVELRWESGHRNEQGRREVGMMDGIWMGMRQDLRHGLRGLRRRPGFAVLTVLTLGLGIGASTAVFSAVHGVLLRDLPYEHAERALVVFHEDTQTGERGNGLSPANARDLDERSDRLAEVAVARPWGADLMVDGRAQSLRGWTVSAGFFEALGVESALGRLPLAEEYVPGADPVVVLGHRSWSNRFGADPALVGSTVNFNEGSAIVAGVLPPEFEFPDEAEFWVPRPPQPTDERERGSDFMVGVARLADGVTLETARAEASGIATELATLYPETNATRTFELVPLREHLLGDIRTPLLVLLGAVGLVLLIACANVAGLLLARGVRRQREYALRRALGATTARLARQLTVESGLLGGLGCLAGIALASAGVEVIRDLGVQHLPRIDELRVDGAVLAFAVGAAALSALVAGILPSLELSRVERLGALGEGGRGATLGPSSGRSGRRLVVIEVAAAMVLVVGAGLLAKSFTTLLDRELGFEHEDRLAIQTFVYDVPGGSVAFMRSVRDRMEAVPGVRRVAVTTNVPGATDDVIGSIDIDLPFTVEDRPTPPVGQEPTAAISQVSEDLFEVMGMRVVQGRAFDAFDREDAPPVVVVNETLARRTFGDEPAVGRSIVIGYEPVAREIVGVVADVRPRGHESEPRPEVYFPLAQFPSGALTFVAETEVDPASMIGPLREAVWEVHPEQAVWGAATLEELVGMWLTQRRFNMLLLGAFATVALVLAMIGVYGMVSFGVEQRVAELGIRRVLGGHDGRILGMIVGESLRLAGVGVLLGGAGALLGSRFLRAMLYGIEPTDPLTFGGVAAAVLLVTAFASLAPAVRAVRADPMEAVRSE